ncbi:putative cyclin-B3-1 isoform X2 [Cinnamomum micranthum f. kanehirae]|uniref:Putative cyclin-B3-1 isoform X2 n=1 Tax=Cinnamomum micranthum f. kanehirae TaxID=337451 RepID=A0A3S3QK35_9MAGN|nr:putative cyclin-B3-1 isoform X2 [Cinnamomum micranthum f. kanehirae]
MVSSFKGKTKGRETLAEDLRTFKNFSVRDFKIYSDSEKMKTRSRKSLDDDERKIARKPPLATRKSVPANVVSKQGVKVDVENRGKIMEKSVASVKTKGGRKALADVSNIKRNPLGNRPSDGSRLKVSVRFGTIDANLSSRKPTMGKTEILNSQILEDCHELNSGSCKTAGAEIVKNCSDNEKINGQSRRSLVENNGKSISSRRISKGLSGEAKTVMTKGYQHKSSSVMANFKYSEKIKAKSSISVDTRTRRKPLAEISHSRTHPLEGSNDGLKMIKTQSVKFLSKPRLSLTIQKVKDANTSSREPVVTSRRITNTSSKVRMTSKSKHTLCTEKKFMSTVKPSMKKEGKVATGYTCENAVLVAPYGRSLEKNPSDGNECSSDSVTAVISKPKSRRRKSYTSLLMERSKVLGECADCVELPNIDDPTNHLEVVEYVDDIYQYYWIMEQAINPSLETYMAIQTNITPRMRGILINWLLEVHLKFELMQETLFLMVELLDRFLSMVTIRKDEMQLVGLTALLLASKYEDFWHPKIKDLISISADIYTRDHMLTMEKLILKKLMFRLNTPTPYVFMLRFLKAAQSDKKLEHLAFYLIELCLVEYEALKFKPSMLCASAIYVARCTLQLIPAWTELLTKYARYEESQLRPCAEMILRFQRAAGQGQLKVTYEKYLLPDRSCVAGIKAIDRLPL